MGDDLIIDVSDSKGNPCGRVVAQVATMADDPVRFCNSFCFLCFKFCLQTGPLWLLLFHVPFVCLIVHIPLKTNEFLVQADKLRWWSIYREPEHELVGRVQLYIHYTTAADESNMKVQMLQICHANIKY
jgi:hypothetical protein